MKNVAGTLSHPCYSVNSNVAILCTAIALTDSHNKLTFNMMWRLEFSRLNEGADFGVILLPQGGFDTAGNIHAKRPHLLDGFGNVLRRQTAGEKDRFAKLLRLDGQVPIEFFAGSPEQVGRISIQQPRVRPVFRQSLQRPGVPDAEGFHAHQPELRAEFRRLVPVKLQQIQATFANRTPDQLLGRIDEDSDAQGKWRQ